MDVLHHVRPSDRADLVGELATRLAPGGRLVVFEHNPLNPVTVNAVQACAFDADAVLLFPWEVTRLLDSLKRWFKTILVISHVDAVKDSVDNILDITHHGMDASVTCE